MPLYNPPDINVEENGVPKGSAQTINLTGDIVSATVAGDVATIDLSAAEVVQKLSFTYLTTSPVLLQQVFAGAVIDRAAILIITPFNGLGASLQLGTTASPGLVLSTTDVNPSIASQYESDLFVPFPASDFLQLLINPTGSTQGEGLLIYKYRS